MSSGYQSRVRRDFPHLAPLAKQFDDYLFYVKNAEYEISGYDPVKGKSVSRSIPHITRYDDVYRKSVIARWYRIEKNFDINTVTMMTLTTAQNGKWSHKYGRPMSIFESCYALKSGWEKVRKLLNKNGISDYAYVYEPHPNSGYPHMHVIIFGDVPDALQLKLKRYWEKKYRVGSEENGIDFRLVNPKHARSYALKYVLKDMKYDGWTYEQYLFHLHFWLTKMRLWGMSRSVSLTVASTRYNSEEDLSVNPASVRWDNQRKVSAMPIWSSLLGFTGQEDDDTVNSIMFLCRDNHSRGSIVK